MTKIFFLKADIDPRKKISLPSKDKITKIFEGSLDKKPSLIKNLPRSTFKNAFLVKAKNKKYVFKVDPLNTRKYKILEYIEGKSLYDLSSHRDITKYTNKLGVTLAEIHKTKVKGYGPNGVYKKWPDYFFLNLNRHLNYLKKEKVITTPISRQISKIFKKYKKKIVCLSPRLLHGDVANHNVILSKNGIELIDWDDSIYGDPLYDVAFYITGVYKNAKWQKTFLAGYNQINKISINSLRFWLYFLRIALIKAVIRKRYGPASTPLPDFTERIFFAIDKVVKKGVSSELNEKK